MSVILLASAAGAPGVSTVSVALALGWSTPVLLVEADPSGPSAVLPGFLRGQVPHNHGILDAAVAARAGELPETLPNLATELAPGVGLLAGLHRPEQSATMAASWGQLAVALADHSHTAGVDVIVDAGRLGTIGFPTPLLGIADRVLLVTRATLAALHATRAWTATVHDSVLDAARLGLLVVGPGHPYTAAEIAKHLQLPVVGTLPMDAPGAARFSDGAPAQRRASDFDRAVARLREQLDTSERVAPAGIAV